MPKAGQMVKLLIEGQEAVVKTAREAAAARREGRRPADARPAHAAHAGAREERLDAALACSRNSSRRGCRIAPRENPGLQRRRLLRAGHYAARRGAAPAGRGDGGGAGARPLRRLQLADARPAAHRAARAERLLLGERHADRLRAHRGHRPARLHCPTWSSPASTSAPTWATTPSIPARSPPPPRATCSASRRSRCRSPARPASISRARSASRCRSSSACGARRSASRCCSTSTCPTSRPRAARHRGHAPRAAPQGRAGGQAADAARRDRVLDRPGRRRRRRRPGHRLPRGRGAARLGDAAAHGPHAQRAARRSPRNGWRQ